MAATLLELVTDIVTSHASVSAMTTEDLIQEIQKVYGTLLALEKGETAAAGAEEPKAPVLSLKKAFQADQVFCMVCGKGGMKTLARHLAQVHGMKPGEYKKQFNIPSGQALTARNFSEARRKMAQDRGLADNLAKAREIRAAKLKAKKAQPAKAKPAKPAAAKTARKKAAK
ncbi:MAG TPA: MucR family transcriptional regulator [Geobacteraceae bacterium]|nr:MucR family transcriptional regulator [Geobacteraceae bacterium]